ncbi:MAG TPA: carboxypeptidase-like regulatory domain-containing protein [Thermoanaerobaculia bacterium]|nr:carboxypeptidase-like regulatory domain-containing protein [Thermoanaerobaculia bacterium]
MTLSRLIRRSAVAAVAILITLFPLAAQSVRRRAAVPPSGITVTLTGIISDAATGQPLANAQVTAGGRPSAFTAADGKYTIQIPKNVNTAVTASQFAYNSSTVAVFGRDGATANFSLTTKPVVTVKLTAPQNGKDTYILDIDSAQFAYLIPFSGYARSDNGNFCKDDGTSITPNKKDIKRVIGPATSVTVGACCTLGPVMKAQLELKSGEALTVYFNDSCFGNEVDFLGREKSSGVFQYFKFTDIAEVDFP